MVILIITCCHKLLFVATRTANYLPEDVHPPSSKHKCPLKFSPKVQLPWGVRDPHTGLTTLTLLGFPASEGHRDRVQTHRTANIHSSENEVSVHPKTMLSNALQAEWARAAGPHSPSAFLPSEIREVLHRAGPGGPRTPPQHPSTAHPVPVSPGHSRTLQACRAFLSTILTA